MKRSPMTIIFLTVFIDLIGFGMILPLSPFYAEHFGASPLEVGLLQASFSLMQFIVAPLWGRLSDRFGRRPVLLMSLLGSSISYFVFGWAQSLSWLFASRIFQGIFTANFGVAQACVADLTAEKDRAKGMGIVGAAFGLGFIFGPFFGAQLSILGFGMGFPATMAGLVCLINFVMALFWLPETLKKGEKAEERKEFIGRFEALKRVFESPQIAALMLVYFLCTFSLANLESTLALFSERRFSFGVRETGQLFAFVGVIMAITQGYLIRKLIPRIGERMMMVWGPLIAAVGFSAVAWSPTWGTLAAVLVFVAIGTGITNPALLGSISLLSSDNRQGIVLGVTQSVGSLARILGPVSGGFFFKHWGIEAPYLIGGGASLIGFLLVVSIATKIPERRGRSHVAH
ncbi:MAG: MFS transporter [Oligoflexia bacterium]|nr:MFS transporter [Oligoflexia bacterium]